VTGDDAGRHTGLSLSLIDPPTRHGNRFFHRAEREVGHRMCTEGDSQSFPLSSQLVCLTRAVVIWLRNAQSSFRYSSQPVSWLLGRCANLDVGQLADIFDQLARLSSIQSFFVEIFVSRFLESQGTSRGCSYRYMLSVCCSRCPRDPQQPRPTSLG